MVKSVNMVDLIYEIGSGCFDKRQRLRLVTATIDSNRGCIEAVVIAEAEGPKLWKISDLKL